MKRGRLYLDYTPNGGLNELSNAQPEIERYAEKKPKLQHRNDVELDEEEKKEASEKKSAYAILVDENGDERDNYEEDDSSIKRKDLLTSIELAKSQGDQSAFSKFKELLDEFEKEQDERLQEEQGLTDVSKTNIEDNPPLDSKSVNELINDFEDVKEDSTEIKTPVAKNISAKLSSEFQKSLEKLGGPKTVYDSVEMHEYAKLVNGSYDFFSHRDFGKSREYIQSANNTYIKGFNEWQVSEPYSSPDNLVYVKYGRDLNNPKIVIACRGTQQLSDMVTNVEMALGGTEQTARFQALEQTYHELQSQFPFGTIEVTGHSQGAGLSYALAQKYNLKGYHFDPAVYPSFRSHIKTITKDAGVSTLSSYASSQSTRLQTQMVYKNNADPISMIMSQMESDKKNVKFKNVDVKSVGNMVTSPHSLSNYYLDGYQGDVSRGIPVIRGGNTRNILEPILKRAVLTRAAGAAGKVGGGIAVGLTLNDTYHGLKRIESDTSLSASEKRTKEWLLTGKNVADFTLSTGAFVSAEAAAAGFLASMGATGAIAIGAPLLMGAAAAVIASQGIKWIGGSLEAHYQELSKIVDPQLMDVVGVKKKKKTKKV